MQNQNQNQNQDELAVLPEIVIIHQVDGGSYVVSAAWLKTDIGLRWLLDNMQNFEWADHNVKLRGFHLNPHQNLVSSANDLSMILKDFGAEE